MPHDVLILLATTREALYALVPGTHVMVHSTVVSFTAAMSLDDLHLGDIGGIDTLMGPGRPGWIGLCQRTG